MPVYRNGGIKSAENLGEASSSFESGNRVSVEHMFDRTVYIRQYDLTFLVILTGLYTA